MRHEPWLKSQVAYGQELVHSAVEGARSARAHTPATEPVSIVLRRSAVESLPWMVIGASLGIIAGFSARKHKAVRNPAFLGLLGGVFGLGANLAMCARQLTGEMVHGAVRNINSTRDAHWLASHPIDYA